MNTINVFVLVGTIFDSPSEPFVKAFAKIPSAREGQPNSTVVLEIDNRLEDECNILTGLATGADSPAWVTGSVGKLDDYVLIKVNRRGIGESLPTPVGFGQNSINLVGHVGRDPEMRYAGDTPVTSLSLAVNQGKNNKPDWFTLEIWGRQGEVAQQYVRKGAQLAVHGQFRVDSWTDKQTGAAAMRMVVRVVRWEFIGSKQEQAASPASSPKRSLYDI